MGALVTNQVPIPLVSSLPPVALVAVVLVVAAIPLLITQWRLTLFVLLAWFMVEDLVRKFAGNNLAAYAVKDVIYVVLIIGLFADPEVRGKFREVTGRARIALYVLILWAAILMVPTLFQDWRLPIVAFRLDFAYVPLVLVGAMVARDQKGLYSVLAWIAILGAGASMLGIIQAVVGPAFLAPETITPGLDNLVTIRAVSGGGEVFRPSGPFVDPGRYGQVASATMVAGLAASLLKRGRRRIPALAAAGICAAGVWVSAGRSPLLVAMALILLAAIAPAWSEHRPGFTRMVPLAVVGMIVVVTLSVLYPLLLPSRATYYTSTLDPRSTRSEWSRRWSDYTEDTLEGIANGGLLGRGTGEESLGRQYLLGGANASAAGLYQVEAGYGAVAAEWGVIGLILWITWMVMWFARGWRSVRSSRGGQIGAMALVLYAWTFVLLGFQFFAGMQVFQNYLINAYFWLFSGVVFAAPALVRSLASEQVEDPEPPALVS